MNAKERAADNLQKDPDYYKKLALKAQEKWVANGRKPRGFSVHRDLARVAGKKGGEANRK